MATEIKLARTHPEAGSERIANRYAENHDVDYASALVKSQRGER